jgi:hypothetical protein
MRAVSMENSGRWSVVSGRYPVEAPTAQPFYRDSFPRFFCLSMENSGQWSVVGGRYPVEAPTAQPFYRDSFPRFFRLFMENSGRWSVVSGQERLRKCGFSVTFRFFVARLHLSERPRLRYDTLMRSG